MRKRIAASTLVLLFVGSLTSEARAQLLAAERPAGDSFQIEPPHIHPESFRGTTPATTVPSIYGVSGGQSMAARAIVGAMVRLPDYEIHFAR